MLDDSINQGSTPNTKTTTPITMSSIHENSNLSTITINTSVTTSRTTQNGNPKIISTTPHVTSVTDQKGRIATLQTTASQY